MACFNSKNFCPLSYDIKLSDKFYSVQSADTIATPSTDGTTEEQVNVEFKDLISEKTVLEDVVPTLYRPTVSANSELEKYLSRPVKIHSVNWGLGNTVDESINPWHLFLNNDSIKYKLHNYAFIRGDLHIKVMLNASPFYYSGLLVSYKPLEGLYHSAPIIYNGLEELVPLSQLPHLLVLPQTSEGGEMVCPFIYPYEWLRIHGTTGTTDTTQMGELHIDSFSTLRTASSAAGTSIDVQFYAWMDNVQLSGLTVSLAVQSDEYECGAISKPASAIARASGMLSNLPIIGSFMTATSIGAEATANIAALFGYSKVPVVEDVIPVKNLPFHGLATTDISDATEKLTIDSKNELTVNNQCIGEMTSDPLLIKEIVQRPSYLTKFTWAAADASDKLLWNTYVSPFMTSFTLLANSRRINAVPMYLPSTMFSFWRGDIVIELKFLCTQYHRGRVKVAWDPVGDVSATADTTPQAYTSVIDIANNASMKITIPYCQRASYLKVPTSYTANYYGTSALSPDSSDTVNGIFTVRVLNELTSPITSADIEVLVFVYGRENLEFAAPKPINEDIYYYTVQSMDTPLHPDEITLGESSTVDENINLVYMGEKIESLRSLLMRSTMSRVVPIPLNATTEGSRVTFLQNRRPLFKGYDTSGVDSALGHASGVSHSYNWVTNSPYCMLSACFLGERGSITWKVDYDGTSPVSFKVDRIRYPLFSADYAPVVTQFSTANEYGTMKDYTTRQADSAAGSALINQRTNAGLSANLPMYAQIAYLDTSPNTRTEGLSQISATDAMNFEFQQLDVQNVAGDRQLCSLWFNVGPDHSLFYFLNVPTMFYYNAGVPNPPP